MLEVRSFYMDFEYKWHKRVSHGLDDKTAWSEYDRICNDLHKAINKKEILDYHVEIVPI